METRIIMTYLLGCGFKLKSEKKIVAMGNFVVYMYTDDYKTVSKSFKPNLPMWVSLFLVSDFRRKSRGNTNFRPKYHFPS